MKLFLASSADKTLPLLPELIPGVGKKVLFVTNAADPFADDAFWVDWDRDILQKLGYSIHETDLRKTTPQDLEALLQTNDILHMCGGSVYYITGLLRQKGFGQSIVRAIQNNSIVYTGTSAGAIIPSKNIKAFSYDQEEAEHIEKVPDHRGLGLVDFVIVPHCNNTDFADAHKKIVEHMPHNAEALFFLQDNQAIWVEDDHVRFLSI